MFGVSNLCWNNDDYAKRILDRYNIKYIEVAPTKLVKWCNLTSNILIEYEKKMEKKIISLQSILYKTNLSITNETHIEKIQNHFNKILYICYKVKIPKIVFGSPKSRLVSSPKEKDIFIKNFKEINKLAKQYNVKVCIEPNSKLYGCNFMTNIFETITILKELNCSNIKLHIDTGNMMMENDNILNIANTVPYLESIHISDHNLGYINNSLHKDFSEIFEYINYNKYITLETITTDLEKNIKMVLQFYQFKYKKCCLIGHTGFIGSNLKDKMFFTDYYNSINISEIKNKKYDEVYCCGLPGSKWIANKYPDDDNNKIAILLTYIKTIKCNKFILISTIDVYDNKDNTNENTKININMLDIYGKNRIIFEKEIIKIFNNYSIFRLGALYGKYLKKNIIFDLLNQNRINHINPNSYFQWYNVSNILNDIYLYKNHKIINLFSKPVLTKNICNLFGYEKYIYKNEPSIIKYNIKSNIYKQEEEIEILKDIQYYITNQKKIYNVYLINTKELPIPWTHGLCCDKFLQGFMYNGCHIYNIKNFSDLKKINDTENNIFIYSNHYKFFPKTFTTAMNQLEMISNIFQKTWHICWYMEDLKIKNKFPFKNYILTGERKINSNRIYKSYEKHILPMMFGVDLNPYEELTYDNDIQKCKYISCFIGTSYKKNWTNNLEKCLYFTHQKTGRFCIGKEKEDIMRNSIFGLGFNSDANVKDGVVTDRIYESLAYCKVCLTDSQQAVIDTDGIAVYVSDKDDLKKKIDYYLTHEYERNIKNQLGKELIKKKGTYFHTAKEFINMIIYYRK
jgi:sugar phosphate isomerase/epimerase